MEIREATIHDARRISYLINKITESNPNQYTTEQIKAWQKYNAPSQIKKQIRDRKVFCAFKNNKLIGTIALKNDEVVGFNVSYSFRGRGIGSILLSYLEVYAKQNHIKKLYLTSTSSALKFYLSKGYIASGAINFSIFGIDFPEVKMQKEL